MKNTLKKIAAIVLVSATMLSLAACSKGSSAKKITKEEFISKAEKKGYQIMDGDLETDNMTVSVVAYNSDGSVLLQYTNFTSKDSAKLYFDSMKDVAEDSKKSGEIKKLSTSSSKIEATDDTNYTVFVYAEDMIVIAITDADKSSAADSALKTIGVL